MQRNRRKINNKRRKVIIITIIARLSIRIINSEVQALRILLDTFRNIRSGKTWKKTCKSMAKELIKIKKVQRQMVKVSQKDMTKRQKRNKRRCRKT